VAKWVKEMDDDKLASELASGGAPLELSVPTDDLGVAETPVR